MYYSFFGFGLLLRFQCKFTNNKKLRFAKCWSVKLSIWPESILFTSIGIIIFHSITLLYYVLCVSARLCYICCCCSMIIAHLVSSNLSIRKPFSFSCRQTKYRKFCLWKSMFCLFLALSPASIVLLYFQFFFLVANDERHLCKITIEIALLSIINYVVWIRTFFSLCESGRFRVLYADVDVVWSIYCGFVAKSIFIERSVRMLLVVAVRVICTMCLCSIQL